MPRAKLRPISLQPNTMPLVGARYRASCYGAKDIELQLQENRARREKPAGKVPQSAPDKGQSDKQQGSPMGSLPQQGNVRKRQKVRRATNLPAWHWSQRSEDYLDTGTRQPHMGHP